MDGELEAILIDVDGCLLPTDGDVPPDFYFGLKRVSSFIKQANQGKLPPIGFCTGRDRNYVEAAAFFVGIPRFWSVIESGAALFNPQTKELLPNPALTDEVRAAFREIAEETIPKILERHPDLFLYPGNTICVALERKHQATLTIEEAYEEVRLEMDDFLQRGLTRITHSDCAIDISPAGIDKAAGLKFLASHTGINLAQSLGIGDSRGDFLLFEQAGVVGCPANASEACKESVRAKKGYISPHLYARGVADVIAHYSKKRG